MKNLVVVILISLLVIGCRKEQVVLNDYFVWELNPEDYRTMDLRPIVDSIYLVPLETNDSSLIKKVYAIDYCNGKFYINNNQAEVQVFDSVGNHLFGTGRLLGAGPTEYTSAVAFKVQAEDTLEIFDAISLRMRKYLYPNGFVSSYKLPQNILPSYQYEWLNSDTCVFSSGSTQNPVLTFYSKSRNKIIRKIEDEQETPFVKTSNTLYKGNGRIYFSSPYPSNELYAITDDLEKKFVLQLDFGEYNFSMKNLPEGMSSKYYSEYIFTHREYAFPYSKFIMGNRLLSYFQFRGNLYVAYMDRSKNISTIYKNEIGSRPQFMIPHYMKGDSLFYASEPGYLSYLVDTTLMSKKEIRKMDTITETDNPIVIIYKMRDS